MPLSESDLKHLWDMLDAARRAREYTRSVTQQAYTSDAMRKDAVVRVIEVVGEAARRVSKEGQAEVSAVQWSAIIATRHIMAHEYDEVDYEQVWRIATIHIPVLISQLEPVLRAHPPGPEASRPLLDP